MKKALGIALLVVVVLMLAVSSLVVPLVISHGIRALIVEPLVVPGATMAPTVSPDDRILVAKLGTSVKVGEIVALRSPANPSTRIIKRVIALDGQTVDLRDGKVYVDGRLLVEPYVGGVETVPLSPSVTFPYKVPSGAVWVMGDNRMNSGDSRLFGAVLDGDLIGTVVAIYWPPNRVRGL